ncbi:MAG: hypothetical protein V1844_27035 [Pseudomonadota bacterium]
MNYRKGLVYFIDVLGTKNSNFDELYKIANIFHNELGNTQNRHNPNAIGNRRVMGFSDCAYIIYSLKDEHLGNEETRIGYIYTSMYNTSIMMNIFTNSGFLCRGGVCYDDIYYETDRNVIFGPAVNQAYLLESKHANVPRILLDDKLADEINLFDSLVKKANPLAIQNGNILMQDPSDGKYFLNYLNTFYQHHEVGAGSCYLRLDELLKTSKENSNKTITAVEESLVQCEENKKTSLQNILNKHKWQIWYLTAAVAELNSAPPPFSEQELLAMFMSSKNAGDH